MMMLCWEKDQPSFYLNPGAKPRAEEEYTLKKKVDVKEKNPLFMSPILLEIIMSRFTGSGASFKCFKLHLTVKKKSIVLPVFTCFTL